jgi:hypothetical protein
MDGDIAKPISSRELFGTIAEVLSDCVNRNEWKEKDHVAIA